MSRFRIRRYRKEDLEPVYEAADESREHVGRWMDWLTPEYSRKDAEAWIDYAVDCWERESEFEFVIVDSLDGSVAGACGLNRLNRKDLVCNLGYWVRRSKLRLGAARQAVMLLRDFGFGEIGFNRLEIVVADGNIASRKVAESAGAIYEGIQRCRLTVGPLASDAHMYAVLNENANVPAAAKRV